MRTGEAGTHLRAGLIVNPVAGMGGRVGLKGTDGADTLAEAISRGAQPESWLRTAEALQALEPLTGQLEWVTGPGEMGERVVREAGGEPRVLPLSDAKPSTAGGTTGRHTREAATRIEEAGVELLLFAGGDGTARDIVGEVEDRIVCLGIPTGVKMHSAVFGVNPARAGELAAHYLGLGRRSTRPAEVMDIDEVALRDGHVAARLFGYMTIPYRRGHVQGLKAGSGPEERVVQQAIAAGIVDRMEADAAYVVGPGTTTEGVMKRLGLDGSLVGVDVVGDGTVLGRDLSEEQILSLLEARRLPDGSPGRIRIIVTPVGGQGYLFGRGNQPISAKVIRQAGREGIIVAATPEKLTALRGRPLRVDTGDPEVDAELAGYYRIASGYQDISVYRVAAA